MEERIAYYIGESGGNEGHTAHWNTENYGIALKEKLRKLGHTTAYYVFGDIDQVTGSILCKCRCANSLKGVIIRCMSFKRHWHDYYNRPADIPFDKKINAVFWRGTTTGKPDKIANRFDLVTRWYGKYDIAFSGICQGRDMYKKYVKGNVPLTHFLKYKYIISVEGNDKDTGLNWKLNSNSLVLMARPRVASWLMETTLVPDYHYILLKDDFSDLEEKLSWCSNNQDRCKEIISNANKFMKQFADEKAEERLEDAVINKYIHNLNRAL